MDVSGPEGDGTSATDDRYLHRLEYHGSLNGQWHLSSNLLELESGLFVHRKGHGRRGISELVAAVMTIAITLIAGAALFGYVNGQAAASENRIGSANAANVNFLNEKFVITDLAIVAGQGTANIWIYNNGNLTVNIRQIVLYEGTKNSLYLIFNGNTASPSGCGTGASPKYGSAGSFTFGPTGTPISGQGPPLQITLTLPTGCVFSSSTTYYASVLGIYGNEVTYPVCDSNAGCTL